MSYIDGFILIPMICPQCGIDQYPLHDAEKGHLYCHHCGYSGSADKFQRAGDVPEPYPFKFACCPVCHKVNVMDWDEYEGKILFQCPSCGFQPHDGEHFIMPSEKEIETYYRQIDAHTGKNYFKALMRGIKRIFLGDAFQKELDAEKKERLTQFIKHALTAIDRNQISSMSDRDAFDAMVDKYLMDPTLTARDATASAEARNSTG
jgi:hypothetical protein